MPASAGAVAGAAADEMTSRRIFITYYSIKSAKTASFTKKYTWPRSKTSTPIQNDTVKM
jgi:hypothetical protein